MKRRAALRANLVFSALAIAASLYLTRVHYAAEGGTTYRPWCTFGTAVDCRGPVTSEFSEILGIPISILGGLFYILVFLLSLLALIRLGRGSKAGEAREDEGGAAVRAETGRFAAGVLLYTALLSAGAVGYSVFLFYASHYILRSLCVFCASLWALNGLLLVSSALALGMGPGAALAQVVEDARFLVAKRARLAATVMVVAVCGGLFALQAHRYCKTKEAALARALKEFGLARPIEVPLSGKEPILGDASATHTLVEWFDFRCGHCRRASEVIERLLREFPGKLRLVINQMPLDPTCNRYVPNSFQSHVRACAGAEAAVCAAEQGKYWEFHDELFLDPDAIGPARIDEIARELGLDIPAFQNCVGSGRGRERVKEDIDRGVQITEALTPADPSGKRRVSVRTPLLLLDGKEVPGIPDRKFWRKVLE